DSNGHKYDEAYTRFLESRPEFQGRPDVIRGMTGSPDLTSLLRRAFQTDPDSKSDLVKVASQLKEDGQIEAAITVGEEIAAKEPKDVSHLVWLISTCLQAKDSDKAEKYFYQAIQHEYEREVLAQLATKLKEDHQYEEALNTGEIIAELEPNNAEHHIW